ncbi:MULTISPECIES: ribosomal protein S18-alanine N-acetyltransferase [Spirulina sp. CCY15215]|uniref:ribosomal protein S18-alanine N-acetyltransferase n=1 Tax=Spirulina sp. CCY15215 TaxID=2767591 RepID=UPI00194E67AA|nr:ribosomal protein S18-alanine N-acetyltransferase [Spirulina major]
MTFSTLQILPLTQAGIEAAVELDRLCLGGMWSLQGYQRELDSPNSEILVLSLPWEGKDNTIVGIGCFWAILEEAHITLLAIHPDYQGQGLGQLLLYSLLEKALQRQLERATLEVRASNQIALSLYQKFGFKEAGRRKKYYPGTEEDALILWCGGLNQPEFNQKLSSLSAQIFSRLAKAGTWQVEPIAF